MQGKNSSKLVMPQKMIDLDKAAAPANAKKVPSILKGIKLSFFHYFKHNSYLTKNSY